MRPLRMALWIPAPVSGPTREAASPASRARPAARRRAVQPRASGQVRSESKLAPSPRMFREGRAGILQEVAEQRGQGGPVASEHADADVGVRLVGGEEPAGAWPWLF